jgi:hypothetical protein
MINANKHSLAHVLFFGWCCNETIFGTRGRSARVEEREERDRIRQWAVDHPIVETSHSNKSFDLSAKPSREVLQRNGLMDLPARGSDVDLGGKEFISRPVHTEHTNYTLNQTGHEFVPANSRTFVLRPAVDSRESLSLAIFETTESTMRPVSQLPLPRTVPEESYFNMGQQVPSLPNQTPPATMSIESLPLPRSRTSSQTMMQPTMPLQAASMDPIARRTSSSHSSSMQSTRPAPHRTNPSQGSSRSSTTVSSTRSQPAAPVDFTQHPHPQYSYFRPASNRTSSAGSASNAPTLPYAQQPYRPDSSSSRSIQMETRPTSSAPPLDRQPVIMLEETQTQPKRESVVFAKRESVYALPPLPSKRESKAARRESKASARSSRIGKPAKLQRKSTLNQVVGSSESTTF